MACRVILGGHTRTIDAGRIEGKLFLNIAGFGFDIAVIEDSLKVRWSAARGFYLYCALRQLHRFPGFGVEMGASGTAGVRREHLMLIIANARVFGGGFRVAPRADLEDGQLDAFGFLNMGLGRRLSIMGRLLPRHARDGAGGRDLESPVVPAPIRPPARVRNRRRVEPGRLRRDHRRERTPCPSGPDARPPMSLAGSRACRSRGSLLRGRLAQPGAGRALRSWPVSVVTPWSASSSSALAGRGRPAPTPGALTISSSSSGPTCLSTKPSTRKE